MHSLSSLSWFSISDFYLSVFCWSFLSWWQSDMKPHGLCEAFSSRFLVSFTWIFIKGVWTHLIFYCQSFAAIIDTSFSMSISFIHRLFCICIYILFWDDFLQQHNCLVVSPPWEPWLFAFSFYPSDKLDKLKYTFVIWSLLLGHHRCWDIVSFSPVDIRLT